MAVIHSDAPPVHRPWRRHVGFGAGSALLLAGTVWMIYFDYARDWKGYQRDFRRMEIDKAQERLEEVGARLDADQELARLEDEREQATAEMAQRAGELESARRALDEAEKAFYVAEQEWKVEKSHYDARKYEFEEARRHIMESGLDEAARDAAVAQEAAHFKHYEDRYVASVRGLEEATTARDAAAAEIKKRTGRQDDLRKRIAQITADEEALHRTIEANRESLKTLLLNAPVIDMAAPTLKIEQVILPHLLSDINFTRIPKVDRCVTCHKGIADSKYRQEGQPFTTHPALDLYLTDSSPHPYNRFGCTVCHQGLDRATSFISAMHTPRGEEQEHAWAHDHGWAEPHYWDSPQLPAQHAQAACRTCHIQDVRLKGADRYNRGLDILEKAGCYGCHKIAGYEEQRKAGPSLRHIASKVKADWAYRWIEDPKAYRPTTWMPRFFHLTNTSSPDDRARSQTEIDAIVAYLWARSTPAPAPSGRVPAGDSGRGRRLVSDKGCLGCHRIGEKPAERGTFGRDFGPALDRVGDKVSAEWLFEWVRDPRRYFPQTNMPDLRLTDQEAADVTAYLMTLRGGDPEPPPPASTERLDAVTAEFLMAKLTSRQAQEKLASMGTEEKKVFLGEKLVARYGCFGCHDIAGFEQALPIGVELSNEGTKLITRLDFGFADIPHTKPAWFLQKMKDPRVFDMGKVKSPQEKLKMPDFGFTDEEAETMVTLILSMQKDVLPMEAHRILDEREAAVERGRRIVQDRNCRGCHVIDGEGGAIREVIADQAYYPPNLIGEGAKVQSDWLFDFLKEPEPIRPWLTVTMPTFHFDDRNATDLVKHFAAADGAPFPFQSASPPAQDAEAVRLGKRTFDEFKCLSCHTVGAPAPGIAAADLAPDLTLAWTRLRHDWISKWLRDPQRLLPGTRMPSFFYSEDQPLYPDASERMEAVSEHVLSLGRPRSAASSPRRTPGQDPAGR
ncbi:MAG TPA: c-type cytochrome [Candidatus Polarisedimenticolia bacterium]|nr:c-type cytochrome [Candidatus Polarisedimenticolia bacterium]